MTCWERETSVGVNAEGVVIARVCCAAACCVASLAIRTFLGSCCVAIHPPMLKADRTKNTPDTTANRLALTPSISLTTGKMVFLCSLRERMVRRMNKTVSPLNSAAEINSVNDRYGIMDFGFTILDLRLCNSIVNPKSKIINRKFFRIPVLGWAFGCFLHWGLLQLFPKPGQPPGLLRP